MKMTVAINRNKARGYEHTSYRLHVPSHIAQQVHPDTEFEPELTKDGILYRVVSAPAQPDRRPGWLTKGKAQDG